MKIIIAGSRESFVFEDVEQAFLAFIKDIGIEISDVKEIVSGTCRGVDILGEQVAKKYGIHVEPFPAKWRRPDGSKDKSAGYKRNRQMAQYADALIACWDGSSPGTCNMINLAKEHGLKVFIWRNSGR